MLKKFLFTVAVLMLAACTKVPAGNVGIKVYLLGGSKGVDVEAVGPGRYWLGMNEELYLFPTFTQNYTWTKECVAGDCADESLSFQTVEGLSVNADVGISYAIQEAKVPLVFQKYRKGVDEITDIYLRNMVKDALVAAASDQPIESVYGKGKADLIAEVEASVRKQVEPIGIMVEKIYWTGDIRLPTSVVESLNAKIKATQIAMQRENEVRTAEAQAAITVAKANGEAEARIIEAKAQADAIKMKGEAEAAALEAKNQALARNPKLVELIAAERWTGELPSHMYGGGAVPFINVSPSK